MSQSVPSHVKHSPTAEEFRTAQKSPEFQELRSKQRGFTFPITIAGLLWFITYVLVAMYAPSFLSIKILGNINLGILVGLLQFATTFAITWLYVSFANKQLEPRSRAIREALENQERP